MNALAIDKSKLFHMHILGKDELDVISQHFSRYFVECCEHSEGLSLAVAFGILSFRVSWLTCLITSPLL